MLTVMFWMPVFATRRETGMETDGGVLTLTESEQEPYITKLDRALSPRFDAVLSSPESVDTLVTLKEFG